MKIEDITVEKICRIQNLNPTLKELTSKNASERNEAVSQLINVYHFGKRKEALYSLIGYYMIEVKTLNEIESFFDAIKWAVPLELITLILKDLTKDKNLYRRKLFVDSLYNKLGSIALDTTEDKLGELESIIEGAVWGIKLKARFKEAIYGNY